MKTVAEKLQDGGNDHRYVFLVKMAGKESVVVDTFCTLEVPAMKQEHLDTMVALSSTYLSSERMRDCVKLENMRLRMTYSNNAYHFFNSTFLIETDDEINSEELTEYLQSLYNRRELRDFLKSIIYEHM